MSNYKEQMLARREQPRVLRTLEPAGEQVIAEITCSAGGRYYLRSCERDCGATVCHRCGSPARASALFNADLVEKFGWHARIEEMDATELIRFTSVFNVECKNDRFPAGSHTGATTSPLSLFMWEQVR